MLKLKAAPNKPLPFEFQVGDTVIVHTKVQEDEKTRIQKFEGIVIGIQGQGVGRTFTVRRIGTNEISVERIFPVYSPMIDRMTVKRAGQVRRAKLYYLRDRKGKQATYVKPRGKSAS